MTGLMWNLKVKKDGFEVCWSGLPLLDKRILILVLSMINIDILILLIWSL